jgi:hypothetical protein
MSELALGDKVRDTSEEGSPSWRVVGLEEDRVDLSGPGPCRGMRLLTRDEFDATWEKVDG